MTFRASHLVPLLLATLAGGCSSQLGGADDDGAGGGGAGGVSESTSTSTPQGPGGGGETVATCFGEAEYDLEADELPCGDKTCGPRQACVRSDYAVSGPDAADSCPAPDGCEQPPDGTCWMYECQLLPDDCSSCDCLEPQLAYDTMPAATCSETEGAIWIAGAPWERTPWKDPCFGACEGDETCWECGPSGGCSEEVLGEGACNPGHSCAVEDPSGYPHPTCFQMSPI